MNLMTNVFSAVALAAAAIAGSAEATATMPQSADAPAAQLKPLSQPYRFTVGKIEVSALSDGDATLDVHDTLKGIPTADSDALLAHQSLSNPLQNSINAFVFRSGKHVVLVDTGTGGLLGPTAGRLGESLRAAGFRPEDVTDVLVTHAHVDHTGGLVAGGHVAFPNAIVHVAAAETSFFFDKSNATRTGYPAMFFDGAIATLQPYEKAGKLVTFRDGDEVLPGITATLQPGHTPGMATYTLSSGSHRLVFIGDIVHVAAIQFPRPAVTIIYDVDQPAAARTRAAAFGTFARSDALVASPHLPFPGVGHIRQDGSAYRWVSLR